VLEIVQLPFLKDNYVYLLHQEPSGLTFAVDPGEAGPVLAALAERAWKLSHVLSTHHHADHVGGNLVPKAKTGCSIVGAAMDALRIPGIDRGVADGDAVELGAVTAQVLEVPATLWATSPIGSRRNGRSFVATRSFPWVVAAYLKAAPNQMWTSLQKLCALPPDTRVFCAHEYTEANGRFASTLEPNNPVLKIRLEEVAERVAKGLPTVPATLAEERGTNPFLRQKSPELRQSLGLPSATELEVFTETRKRKDQFRG